MNPYLIIYYKNQMPIVITSVAVILAATPELAKDVFVQDKHLSESAKDFLIVTPLTQPPRSKKYYEDDIKRLLKF